MKYFLLILILIKLSISDVKDSGQKVFQNIEKKAKALACSILSKSFLNSAKDYDNKLKEILKEKKLIKNESEAKDKITQIMLVTCFQKITKEMANKAILDISKGNLDINKNKQYLKLFEIDKNLDFNQLVQTMKELNEIMKEIEAEEELFAKKNKDDPNFMKNMKDFEEKMKKNFEQKKNEKNKNNNVKQTSKKKKGSNKKPYEGTKWEYVESSEEKILDFKDIIRNPKKFFDVTGLNTICGMIIMTLLFIHVLQNLYHSKNDKKEKENKVNEEEINELNKENNDNEEEEEDNEKKNNEKNNNEKNNNEDNNNEKKNNENNENKNENKNDNDNDKNNINNEEEEVIIQKISDDDESEDSDSQQEKKEKD